MGDLASLATYDEYGLPAPMPLPPQQEQPRDLPPWAMGALAHPDYYEPQGTMWPDPNKRAPQGRADPQTQAMIAPDSGMAFGTTSPQEEAFIAPQRSRGAETVADAIIPTSPEDVGLAIATGGASRPFKVAAGAVGSLFDSSEAQAGKGTALKGAVEALANPRLRAKAEALFGKYPQYGQAYPEIGPPELMWKIPDEKNPGKFTSKPGGSLPYANMEEALAKDAEPGFFLQKKLTPEAEQFQKDRATIQSDMDQHGFEPYFDPAKRFDVNAKHYGPFADTGVAGQPKSAKTQAEWAEKYGTDEIRARLRAGFERGKDVPESDRWYFMGQLEKEYIKELGPKAGRAAFKSEFADMMAATTGGASPLRQFPDVTLRQRDQQGRRASARARL
jgi:hypothetical protein